MEMNNPFRIKALVVYDGIDEENATARALRALKQDLRKATLWSRFRSVSATPNSSSPQTRPYSAFWSILTVPTTKNIAAFNIFWNFCAAVTTICPCF